VIRVSERVEVGTGAHAPWAEDDGQRHRFVAHAKSEWLPRPYAGRILLERHRRPTPRATYVQIVPGPERTWQIVRVDLEKPFARGFRTPESARGWLVRALRAGVIPDGTVELEPASTASQKGDQGGDAEPGAGV
jgi:hypothetical protein